MKFFLEYVREQIGIKTYQSAGGINPNIPSAPSLTPANICREPFSNVEFVAKDVIGCWMQRHLMSLDCLLDRTLRKRDDSINSVTAGNIGLLLSTPYK
jgi:hypothetical protein